MAPTHLSTVGQPQTARAGNRVQRIIEHEAQGDEHNWEAARLIWEELDEGLMSQRDLGTAIGKSQQHVSRMAQVWALWITDTLGCQRPSFNDVYQQVKQPGLTDAQLRNQSNSVEWYTPAKYIESARHVLGGIDLDPASCAEANATVKATRFYTAADDGLIRPWSGRVWCNPPYGGLSGKFTARMLDAARSGEIQAGVLLVNAHATDTAWFQPLWDEILCFTDHRIAFSDVEQNTAGSVFAGIGVDPKRFAQEFRHHGAVIRRWL